MGPYTTPATYARLQRKLARQQKFSRNGKKTTRRINTLYARMADIRRDYTQKLNTTVSPHHATVALEDLWIKNMTAPAQGAVEAPGHQVRAESGAQPFHLGVGLGPVVPVGL